MKSELISSDRRDLHLKKIPDWKREGSLISRTYSFRRFLDGIDFVKQLADKAEAVNHHPDIDIRYNKVTLRLTTHDAGGLTEKDFLLASTIDAVYLKFKI